MTSKKMTQRRARVLCDEAKEKIREILLAPVVDPDQPAGFVSREFERKEKLRRLASVDEIQQELLEKLAGDDEIGRKRMAKRRERLK